MRLLWHTIAAVSCMSITFPTATSVIHTGQPFGVAWAAGPNEKFPIEIWLDPVLPPQLPNPRTQRMAIPQILGEFQASQKYMWFPGKYLSTKGVYRIMVKHLSSKGELVKLYSPNFNVS